MMHTEIPRPRLNAILAPMALICILVMSCGTVGSLASPTAEPSAMPTPTPTPTFTDESKAQILELFRKQVQDLNELKWDHAYQICSPEYRTRRDLDRFKNDLQQLLERYDTTAATLDARNVKVTKGRDDRFDITYDSYVDGVYSQSVRVGGAYLFINGVWRDGGALCP